MSLLRTYNTYMHTCMYYVYQGKHGSLSQLVDQGTVAVVLEFFDKYEVSCSALSLKCVDHSDGTPSTQAKCADIDDRLSALYKDQQALSEKIAALQVNADKINPKKKKISNSKDVVRFVNGSRHGGGVL